MSFASPNLTRRGDGGHGSQVGAGASLESTTLGSRTGTWLRLDQNGGGGVHAKLVGSLDVGGARSISMWIYTNNIAAAGERLWQRPFECRTDGGSAATGLGFDLTTHANCDPSTGGTATTYCYLSTKCPGASGCDGSLTMNVFSGLSTERMTSPVGAPYDTWAHVAVTISAWGRVRMYVNGRLTRERDVPVSIVTAEGTTAPDCYVGGTSHVSTQDFDGRIDEFDFWDGELTPEQVHQLYVDAHPSPPCLRGPGASRSLASSPAMPCARARA